jgi:acetolactate synthase small subunit
MLVERNVVVEKDFVIAAVVVAVEKIVDSLVVVRWEKNTPANREGMDVTCRSDGRELLRVHRVRLRYSPP